jgi:hypothetical protein
MPVRRLQERNWGIGYAATPPLNAKHEPQGGRRGPSMLRVNDELVLALEISEFRELKNPLIPQKTDLEQKLTALETGNVSRLEPLKQWVLRANQAEKWVSDDNWVEMKSFLQNVGSNRLLRAETLTVSFKKPWNLLAETTVAMRSVSDASARNSGWWCFLTKARTFFDENPCA